jgi:hypothetical protein
MTTAQENLLFVLVPLVQAVYNENQSLADVARDVRDHANGSLDLKCWFLTFSLTPTFPPVEA